MQYVGKKYFVEKKADAIVREWRGSEIAEKRAQQLFLVSAECCKVCPLPPVGFFLNIPRRNLKESESDTSQNISASNLESAGTFQLGSNLKSVRIL